MRRLGLLLAVLMLALGCQQYHDFWTDYDTQHPTCRTDAPNSITGATTTTCPPPGG